MKNDKVKKWLCLILIFGGFFILRNFVPSGLDQAGWDGFLVLFVAVLLWLTEAVPMAVTAVFVLFFGAWVGFEKEANILANFASRAGCRTPETAPTWSAAWGCTHTAAV